MPQKDIRILIIAPTLDTFLGGQAVQAARLMTRLNREPGVKADIQSIGPVMIPSLDRIKYVRTVLRETKFLYDVLTKTRKYDIVHICSAAHVSFMLTPVPAAIVSKLYGKKTILNYRSGQLEEHYANWGAVLDRAFKLFDMIVAPSGYLVDVFAKYGFEARSIFNIIDTSRFTFRERRPLRPVFLSNRLHEELYNIPCLLRAFGRVQRQISESRLIVAGFGDQSEFLENYAKELGLNNVDFVGKVTHERMAELYNQVDVYLNSPNTDNMPGSILECYASGVPVVTTNAGGIPYILEHEKTGLMVQVNDDEGMAQAALRLLSDNELAQTLIHNGREAVKEYSWERVGPKWIGVYEELVG